MKTMMIELDAVQIDLLASLLAQSQPQGVATMRLVVGLVDTLEAAERELPEGERRRSKVRGAPSEAAGGPS